MRTDRAVAVLASGLALGILAQYLFVGERAGIGFVVLIGAVLVLDALLRSRRAPSFGAHLLLPAGALMFAGFVAVRTDGSLIPFDVEAALALCLLSVMSSRGFDVLRIHVAAVPGLAGEGLRAVAMRLPEVYRVALPTVAVQTRARSSRALPYASGLALAAPLLVVFVLLFSAADAVFQRSLRDALDIAWLREILPTLPQRLAVALVVTWCATGALAMSTARVQGGAERRVRRLLGAEPVTVALVAIDLLFAAFVALQLTYLFGGRDTLQASGIAYSAYARRGFFELLGVAALVGAVLFTFDLVVRTRSRVYVIAALVLVALTSCVLASAATRMTLYQEAYGWTELRLYAYAGIAFIAIALAILAGAVVTRGMERVVGPLAGAALAVALAVNAIGPSAQVAAANIDRFLDPAALPVDAVRDLDLTYLIALGDGAVPAIVERLPALPDPERLRLTGALRVVYASRHDVTSWPSWNWDRARASELLSRQ